MYIIKVLKRRDTASLLVAIPLGLIIAQLLPTLAARLSGIISGLDEGTYLSYSYPDSGWQGAYLQPVVSAILQIIFLEVIVRIVVWVRPLFVRKAR